MKLHSPAGIKLGLTPIREVMLGALEPLVPITASFLALCSAALAGGLPGRVGACVATRIESVETRLIDGSTRKPIPGPGSAVRFENGSYLVSYDTVARDRATEGGRCRADVPRFHPAQLPKGRPARPRLPHHQLAHATKLATSGFAAHVRRRMSPRLVCQYPARIVSVRGKTAQPSAKILSFRARAD